MMLVVFLVDWEQRKVSDIFQVTRGHVLSAKAVSPIKTDSNPYPVYSSQTKNNGLMGYYNEYLFNNAITWTTDGANAGTVNYRPGQFYSTNVNGVLLSNDGYVNKAVAESLDKVSYKFVSHVGNPKLMNNVMSEIIINIPSEIAEQARMSELLIDLDHSVTLHQRITSYVEWAFHSAFFFIEKVMYDWEQRKLGDEFVKVNERNNGQFAKDKWISVAKMYFQSVDKVQSNNIDTRTYVMRMGDIAFEGHPNKDFRFGRFVANDIGDGVVSELFPIYRHIGKYDLEYWKYAIHLERIMGPILSKSITSSGNSSNKINEHHFLKHRINVPNLNEQRKIGHLLKELEIALTLHQRIVPP